MSKVITFSRQYPACHPKKGQPTQFVEKVWMSLIAGGLISMSKCCELSRETGIGGVDTNNLRKCDLKPKHHTIRAGTRWKIGDKFSPRVWSGKPYNSPQIIIAPDIEIVKLWDFEMDKCGIYSVNNMCILEDSEVETLAGNDGLTEVDMFHWFMPNYSKPKAFRGQIICWNEDINY